MKRVICTALTLILLSGCGCVAPELQASEQVCASAPVFDPMYYISSMTTEELVGQLFLARCPSDSSAYQHVQQYHLGGYILFGRDFENQTPDSVKATIAGYQSAAQIPLLIAVDEEGGTVNRVSSQPVFRSERFPSPRSLYTSGGLALLCSTEVEKSQLLASIGINVNMAPVCDITTDPEAFMYDRSLGLDPEATGKCIASMVEVMDGHRIGSVLKHFPGYGNNTDTHMGIAFDDRTLQQLQADLTPFQAGIDARCGAILVSHTVIQAMDPELPASLSPKVIGYLRSEMGFQGVVVTDDLVMGAIVQQYGAGEAAVLAVLAGNDLLCSSEYAIQYQAVLQAVKDGRIPLSQVQEAAGRVLQWKYRLGLLPLPPVTKSP